MSTSKYMIIANKLTKCHYAGQNLADTT